MSKHEPFKYGEDYYYGPTPSGHAGIIGTDKGVSKAVDQCYDMPWGPCLACTLMAGAPLFTLFCVLGFCGVCCYLGDDLHWVLCAAGAAGFLLLGIAAYIKIASK